MQLILQLSTNDFSMLDELCETISNTINEKITVANYIELMIQEELKLKSAIESSQKTVLYQKRSCNQ
ncbi:MAG: hypothetical protein ACLUQ0_03425 [Enterococcus italicus]|uniref:hypothetical protein n=1 Tax=Enterococcus italicus TaxID=246144 RepID=UPI00399686F9